MDLDDTAVSKLISIIQDTFRVRENHTPHYVDIAGHLGRVMSKQHQVVFGRRGSGKSCLLVTCYQKAMSQDTLSIYVSADEVKKLTYPDVLIRLLIAALEKMHERALPWWRCLARLRSPVKQHLKELRNLLDAPERSDVTTEDRQEQDDGADASAAVRSAKVSLSRKRKRGSAKRATFVENKIDYLERHLQDFKSGIRKTLVTSKYTHAIFIIDDFYLVKLPTQPDVIDYLHRLTRGLAIYLKIGTIRHRTRLRRHAEQTIGVELYQDVEPIELDHTLSDLGRTKQFLSEMLDALGNQARIPSASRDLFNPEALESLTLASGGVPRDFLTIFVEAVPIAKQRTTRWLTPTNINRAAHRASYRTKLTNLRDELGSEASELETAFIDLLSFCLKDKKKTMFLISQEEARNHVREHETIKQLMDFRLIHVVEPDTSAASGRQGRYEAYTLDFSLFMEPRRRGIEIVEFWKTDDQRRPIGVREAPVYPLERLRIAQRETQSGTVDVLLNEIEADTEEEPPVVDDAPLFRQTE